MSVRLIKLNQIRLDGGTQMRESLDQSIVASFGEDMRTGAVFPPVDVFHDGNKYWLADGFHRFYAARDVKKLASMKATVHEGSVRDAVLFSVGANASHGVRRTNADKRRSVTTLLGDDEWSGWSDGIVAEKCGVSQPFVSKVRGQLITVMSCDDGQPSKSRPVPQQTKGKDGKTRKRRTRPKLPHPDEVVADSEPCPTETVALVELEPVDPVQPTPKVSKPAVDFKHLVSIAQQDVRSTVTAFLALNPPSDIAMELARILAEMQSLTEKSKWST